MGVIDALLFGGQPNLFHQLHRGVHAHIGLYEYFFKFFPEFLIQLAGVLYQFLYFPGQILPGLAQTLFKFLQKVKPKLAVFFLGVFRLLRLITGCAGFLFRSRSFFFGEGFDKIQKTFPFRIQAIRCPCCHRPATSGQAGFRFLRGRFLFGEGIDAVQKPVLLGLRGFRQLFRPCLGRRRFTGRGFLFAIEKRHGLILSVSM